MRIGIVDLRKILTGNWREPASTMSYPASFIYSS